jgi:hypothetical protein
MLVVSTNSRKLAVMAAVILIEVTLPILELPVCCNYSRR